MTRHHLPPQWWTRATTEEDVVSPPQRRSPLRPNAAGRRRSRFSSQPTRWTRPEDSSPHRCAWICNGCRGPAAEENERLWGCCTAISTVSLMGLVHTQRTQSLSSAWRGRAFPILSLWRSHDHLLYLWLTCAPCLEMSIKDSIEQAKSKWSRDLDLDWVLYVWIRPSGKQRKPF